ncbi:hypothetical protein [Rhizobium leguminosarum]|nr:hypothetical protein [Rhizobium leguminosarum]
MNEYARNKRETPEGREYVREYQKTPERREYKLNYRRKQRLDQAYLDRENDYAEQRRATPEYKEYRRQYEGRRRREDPAFRIKQSISRAISSSLKSGKGGRRSFDILGYSRVELMESLERKFLPGMSWENYGEWHIDHIIPLAAHNITSVDDIDFRQAWSLGNLRPLWAIDNMKKGAKLSKPFQPSLALALSAANDNAKSGQKTGRREQVQ